MKRASTPEVVSDGKVIALEPEVVSVRGAAMMCACSVSLLNTLRATDVKRLQRGEEILGPPWVRLGYGIRYRVRDLRAWLTRTSVHCGVMDSRRRRTPESTPKCTEAAR